MSGKFVIQNQWLSLQELEDILSGACLVELGDAAKHAIHSGRQYLERKMESSSKPIYGVNTGFGSLCNTVVPDEQLEQLQRNLVLSHACGMGIEVPNHLVRRMLLLKVLGLSHGYSGVRLETVQRLLDFYNLGVFPIVYEQGSLGASGDLAPLAHLVLPLIGEGEAMFQGKRWSGAALLEELSLSPLSLASKEGLALLNGTQFMSAYASNAIHESYKLWNNWLITAATSLDAFDGRIEPFQENVNRIRQQNGQMKIAAEMRMLLEGSELAHREKQHVQDPYSFRCIPQVQGASWDTLEHCAKVIENEINAVTDNPTVFPEDDDVVSAGNFHGQPLALAMDFLAIAMAEMGSISERRVYKLISGTRGLPPFLAQNPGLHSGFMIAQYTCAAIVSQNKQLCAPASVDSIDSSNGQEDHVSMGANAATKLNRIIENCFSIQAIEWLTACQALDYRRPLKSSPLIDQKHAAFRIMVPYLEQDAYMHPILEKSVYFVKNHLQRS